jgi:hypothetical protein
MIVTRFEVFMVILEIAARLAPLVRRDQAARPRSPTAQRGQRAAARRRAGNQRRRSLQPPELSGHHRCLFAFEPRTVHLW